MESKRTATTYFIPPGKFLLMENALGNPDLIQSSVSSDCRVTIVDKENFPLDELEQWPTFRLTAADILLNLGANLYYIYIVVPMPDNTESTSAFIAYNTALVDRDGYEVLESTDEEGNVTTSKGELLGKEGFRYYQCGTVSARGTNSSATTVPPGQGRLLVVDLGVNPQDSYLEKKVDWSYLNKMFIPHYDDPANPNKLTWIEAKSHMGVQGGVTMFVEGDGINLPNIYDGLRVDGESIYWEEIKDEEGNVIDKVLKAKADDFKGTLGSLTNVGEWADAAATADRIMVQKKDSTTWTSLSLEELGTASFENVKESGEGNAYTSIELSEDKKTLTLNKGENFAKQTDYETLNAKVTDFLEGSDTDNIINKWKELEKFLGGMTESDELATILSGKADKGTTLEDYGITDAYTKSEVDLALKDYVTIDGKETITGEKNFTGGLMVNGSPIVYDKDKKYWRLTGDLLVTGGVTMFANEGTYSPSTIMDAVNVDGTTIMNDGTKLYLNPDLQLGGLDEEELNSYLTSNKYITQTTGDARYITAIGTSGNSLTYTKNGTTQNVTVPYATSASKLSTTSAYTAWGHTYWNNGVPTSVSGDMTGVGNISMTGSINSAVTINSGDDSSWIKGSGHKMYFGGTGYANQSYYFRPLYGASGATTSNLYIQNASASSSPTFTTTHSFLSNGNASHAGTLTINGIELSKSKDDVLFIDANLVVRGAVTMYGTNSVTASTIMDGILVDGTTIIKDPTTKKLMLNPDLELGGGLDETALASYLTTNKYLTQTTGDTRYVTALGINGNNLTWTKNGAVNDITVPYATTAKELTSYSAITFSKSDNSGMPCYLLIADVTSWYNVSSGATAYGVAGFVYGYRNGASPARSMNINAICAYGKGYYSLDSSLKSIIEPRVVSYNSKYYLALYLQGSNRTFNFIGRKDNLLSSFTELQCSDGNGTYSGLSVIYKGSATGTSSKADSLSTSRTISITGHATGSGSFDGSEDLDINVTIPTRNVYINGTGYTVHSTITTDTTGVYAPTSGGTSGYVLKANGTTSIPTWVAQSNLSVGTASKLSTVSKTAWGQTYWTSGGVPTSISGNMTGVGSITMNGSINYNDYIIFRYSASTGDGGVSTGASLLGSPSLATTLRSSGNDLYHWNAANSAKYLIFDTNNFTNYTNKALTKKNSGTNLLTDGDKYIGAQAYLMGYYTYDSSVTNGVKYRCTLCGKLGDDNTHIAAYWDGGSGNNTTISGLSSTEERTISFTATITNKQRLSFYQFPNGKFGSYIKWCKLEVEEDVTGDTSTYLYNIDRIDFANDSNSHNFGIDRNGTVYGYNAGVLKLRRGKSSGGSYVQYEANNQAVYGWRAGANDVYNFSWWYYDTSSSTGVQKMYLDSSGNLLVTGGITMYSDERKKTILRDVELSLDEVAKAPLIEHYYNSDGKKTTHVGSIAQYWAGLNDWFCKKDGDGYYTMEIQNAALASAISVARELSRFENDTDRRIRLLEEENKRLKEEVKQLKTA